MSVLRLSLSASRARKITHILSNETAVRIMDALDEESKSESVLSQELDIPLSTVHYNVQQLVSVGLLLSDEFTYSSKGKEVRHYRIASKYIVLSVKPSFPTAEVVSGSALALLLAFGITFFSQTSTPSASFDQLSSAEMVRVASEPIVSSSPAVWPWILVGALSVLLSFVVVWFILRK